MLLGMMKWIDAHPNMTVNDLAQLNYEIANLQTALDFIVHGIGH